MTKYVVVSSIVGFFVFVSVCIISAHGLVVHEHDLSKPVHGLSWTFYKDSCPDLEDIVKSVLEPALDEDITQAAGLLRLHFHDCFVQGCDGSVLLTGTKRNPSEQQAQPNLSLRARALQLIDEIKTAVEASCSGVVTCADILALAARDSVAQVGSTLISCNYNFWVCCFEWKFAGGLIEIIILKAGGPKFPVPLGRRDSLKFASQSEVLANIPKPTSNLKELMKNFSSKGFSLAEMVALSGGHTIGIGHCNSFDNRLYDKTTGKKIVDPSIANSLADDLYSLCPTVNNTVHFTNLDVQTPNAFDKKYYENVQKNQVLFTSDQSLYTESDSAEIVDSFASSQTVFFKKFVHGMHKMGQLDVLTGKKGEIRTTCSVPNKAEEVIESVTHSEL